MREFGSLGELAMHVLERRVTMHVTLAEGLTKVVEKIEETARSEFGEYQPAVDGFPAWAELADSTKDERSRLGYPEDEPLLREGDLRDSIGHAVDEVALEGGVGSADPKMVFHEFGTSKMPARPVFGPAGFRNKAAIETLIGAAAVSGLIGGDRIHSALGYDFETKE